MKNASKSKKFVEEFQDIKKRRILVVLAGFAIGIGAYYIIQHQPISESRQNYLIGITAPIFAVIYSYIYSKVWRCPSCGKSLNPYGHVQTCPKCEVILDE